MVELLSQSLRWCPKGERMKGGIGERNVTMTTGQVSKSMIDERFFAPAASHALTFFSNCDRESDKC